MPSDLLSVPHFEQSRDGTCLPACVRMVLAYWGQSVTELSLARMLDTKAFGTPISNVTRLTRLGFVVEHHSLGLDQLQAYLSTGIPVITRVWTELFDAQDPLHYRLATLSRQAHTGAGVRAEVDVCAEELLSR